MVLEECQLAVELILVIITNKSLRGNGNFNSSAINSFHLKLNVSQFSLFIAENSACKQFTNRFLISCEFVWIYEWILYIIIKKMENDF